MPSRRRVLCAAVTAALAAPLTACQGGYDSVRLRFITGPAEGLWYTFGLALAGLWHRDLGMRVDVRRCVGPRENIAALLAGQADLSLNSADIAADALTTPGFTPVALGRVYDDVVQVLVRADRPFHRLADLRGKHIWTAAGTGTPVPATSRLLAAAGLFAGRDYFADRSEIPAAFTALTEGRLDALVFSGGLPTPGVLAATRRAPLRMLDVSDVLTAVQGRWGVYGATTVPTSVYRAPAPVTTLTVPNYLLATKRLSDDLVSAMLESMFRGKTNLVRNMPSAQYLDPTNAVETAPVPLHSGAVAYYRSSRP